MHNISEETLTFTKKVSVAQAQGEQRGPVTARVTETLGPNQSLEIDCQNIRDLQVNTGFQNAQFLKGFVVIETESENLQVVAVYTALHKQVHGNDEDDDD
ncbi:MAG: hypothetical protein ACOY4Q_12595 [Bacillota bacterium]